MAFATAPQRLAEAASRRRIDTGDIVGSLEPDGTHAWRGLPFAAPPVGSWRWRAPQPAQPWAGERAALAHGPMAPQYAGLLAPVPPKCHGQIVGDEDCLTLNVHAPAWAAGAVPAGAARRPVMVWIHGGGNAVGTAASYDVLRNYAAQDGLVVVSVNYRLGLLGWWLHPALQAADGATPEERSGNFGTLDLLAALGWVQRNIAAFGGDPGRVTIFGESAGGQHVLCLLASPLAAGLFHRAIAQSPVAETFSPAQASELNDEPLACHHDSAQEVAARLWVADGRAPTVAAAAAALRQLPPAQVAAFLRERTPQQLLGVCQPGSAGIYLGPRPVSDGVVLPAQPLPQVFRGPHWQRVPVILGSNRDEYRTFLADKPEHVRMLPGQLPLLRDRRAYALESGFLSRAWRAANVEPVADAMLAGGHADVWTYRFDWDEAPALPFIRPDLLLGAAHGLEMAFAFRDVQGEFDIFGINTPFNRRGRQAVARAMGDAWTSLARDGAPTLPDGAAWSRCRLAGGPETLLIDSPAGGGLRMAAVRQDMAALKQELQQTAEVQSGAERCRLYARVFRWAPLFRAHGSDAEYTAWCQTFGCSEDLAAFKPVLEM